MARKIKKNEIEGLHEVKGAGYTATKKVKRDKSVNRRAGLHDKLKNLEGEARVKRRKPLGLKHVRRIRKFAAVASLGVVGAIAVVGVGFFAPKTTTELNEDFYTVCYAAPQDGTKPTDHTIVENVGYLNYVLQNQPYWSSEMFSTVTSLGFSQTVETYKQYYDGVLISADVAKGFSSKATQFCVANGVVMWRPSANKNFDKMNTPWSTGEAQAMTINTFKKNRGFPPSEFSVYVLNELTIANAADYSVTDNGDGTYSMTLNLNVNTGVDETSADYYYKLQMKVTGDLYDCPTIHSTSVTYVFDGNWRVLGFEISDSYNAPIAKNFAPGCTSNTKVTFDYGEANAKNTFWEDYFSSEYDRVKDSLVDEGKQEENADNAMGYLSSAFASVLTEGAVFKVDLSVDDLNLNGVVAVEMENSSLSGLSAKLGDILVWLDDETLYINDGASKYKLNVNGLLSSGEEGEEGGDLLGGFDVAALMDQMTEGTFTLNEETGVATLVSEVELFGLKVPMEFEFQKAEDGGVELNFLKAEIPVGGKVVKAKLCFGTKDDKPVIPEDTLKYQDILNDGITFNISLNANGFTLEGIAKIIMQNGAFEGVYADLGEIEVYYDYPHNMLYLSVGNAKYKLNISELNTGDTDLSALLGSFDIKSLLGDVLANLYTSETSLGTSFEIDKDALGSALNAALNIQLYGGLKIDADLALDDLDISLSVALSNSKVTLPDVSVGYHDILNSEITFDVSLSLMTGLEDANGNRDQVTLEGQVALCLSHGAVTEIRAVFEGLAVYFDFSANELYIKVGTTKVMLDLDEMDLSDTSILSSFAGGDIASADLHAAIKELLTNLAGDGKIISTSTEIASVPVKAELDLSDGLSVRAGLNILGVDATAKVGISETALGGLSDEEKEEYIDLLKEGHKIVESLIGNHISATATGTLYSYEDKYADSGYEKYTFDASLEYDKGAISVNEEGVEVDSKAYIHLYIGLTAKHADDDSLYLDIVLMDANPVTGSNGKTTGGYKQDGNFDIYLSVSNRLNNPVPLLIYAPVDEILTLVSMVGAMANLKGIEVENNQQLTSAIKQISEILDRMLISQYLPGSVQDKFASLGDSLIPQILGVSLEELLNNLFGNVKDTVEEVGSSDFSLSDEYVSSIRTTDESLIFVLDSSLIYNSEIDAKDNLTVEFTRFDKDGVYFVGGVSLKNIFFGENQANKLDLGLTLGYDEIKRPNASNAFAGYLNAEGLDTLVNGLINSATHSKDIATDREKEVYGVENLPDYILNHYYYIEGNIVATLNIVNLIKPEVNLDIVALSVTIDEETNEVCINVRIHYKELAADAVKLADIIAIDGESYVDLTIKGGMLYLTRTQMNKLNVKSGLVSFITKLIGYDVDTTDGSVTTYKTPIVTHRVYNLATMGSDLSDIMDLVGYLFNLNEKVMKIVINSVENSACKCCAACQNGDCGGACGCSKCTCTAPVDYSGYDYGQLLATYLDSFCYYDDGVSKAEWRATLCGQFISDLLGMKTSNPAVSFYADYTVDADGKKSYVVSGLEIHETTLNFVEGQNLSMTVKGALEYCNPQLQMKGGYKDETSNNSLLWEEVFGCSSQSIPDTALWKKALDVTKKTYVSIDPSDANALLKLGKLKFNLNGEEYAQGKNVLFTNSEVLSDYVMPDIPEKHGYTLNTVFDPLTATLNSYYVANTYQIVVDYGTADFAQESASYTYGDSFDISPYLGKTYVGSDGATYKLKGFDLDGVVYGAGNSVIGHEALADIYCKDITLNAVWEMLGEVRVTLSSTVAFSYTGYDGSNPLVFNDGINYAITDATAEGYIFLGWWYEDNGNWRKVVSVEEFCVEAQIVNVNLEALWLKIDTLSCTTRWDDYRKGITLYVRYYFESEVSYHFEGNSDLCGNIICTDTKYRMYFNNGGGFNETESHFTQNFEGSQNKLEQQIVELKDNWGSAKFSHWNLIVTLSFTLPDGSSWTTPQNQMYLSGKY